MGATADVRTAGATAESWPQNRYANILHLTDLHFQATPSINEQVARRHVHHEMVKLLKEIVRAGRRARRDERPLDDWRPDIIAISGDVARTGSREDYDEANARLAEIVECTGVPPENVVMCPGNHDRTRGQDSGMAPPASAEISDRWLSPDTFLRGDMNLLKPFAEYVEFCERFGAMRPAGISGAEYLTGTCSVALPERDCSVQFLVVNSAWFSGLSTSDVREMWIGQRLIQKLSLDLADGDPGVVRVGLCHHTREWLHEEEHDSYSDREPTYRFFARRCHVVLHGHVHGGLEAPSRPYNTAQAFTGGASYAGGNYRNNFSLLQVNLDDRSVRRRGFEYEPRESSWRDVDHVLGTYDLALDGNEPPPDEVTRDLSGDWWSVFWQGELASELKPTRAARLIPVENEDDPGIWFRTPGWNDRDPLDVDPNEAGEPLSMRGKLERGFFTGVWKDPVSVRDGDGGARFGAFQLKVFNDGREMVGWWVGFNRDRTVLTGRWRFAKRAGDAT